MLFSSAPALCTPRSVRTAVLAAKFAARNAGAGDTLLVHDTRPVSALRAHDETGCIGCVKVARIRKRGKRQIASRVVLPRGGKGRSHRSSPQLPRVKERSRGQLRYPPFLLL
ncbi:hypothetical protein PF004_g10078 [Phytophthora fragariae]|uniref:Uncharacterized protein n=1 Tax=Phytophthora fragariae TaxID=53985 RepID=A0A6G0P233_9STRA|nr:hypothetical protein PF004_g10078 [Phytophthora fragariae]